MPGSHGRIERSEPGSQRQGGEARRRGSLSSSELRPHDSRAPMLRRVFRRWPAILLGVAALGLATALSAVLLRDWRVRLHTLVQLDPAAAPLDVRVAGHRLAI